MRRRQGWSLKLLFGVRGFHVYTECPYRFYVVVGPWAISVLPWSRTSRYGNGSRWHSGWYRWREVELEA